MVVPSQWNQQADRSAAAVLRQSLGNRWRWVRRHKLLAALLTIGVIVLTLLYGLEVAAERGGHSIDPTDPMNYNSYALRNDSATALYVHRCADPACTRLDQHFEWIAVRAGSATDEQVYWGPGESAGYAVATSTTTAGARRCLLVDAETKASAPVDLPLSSAGSCRP